MPFTFSHPLAVIPFRRLCPQWLSFAALVIGSMSPDFGYFVNQFDLAAFAHTILGSFAVCLPTGLAALWVFYLLRQPFCYMLPEPHRSALTPFAATCKLLTMRALLTAAVSILLGAWTHSLWDSFTHRNSWPVKRFEVLHMPVFHLAGEEILVHRVLQYASTAVGGVCLIALYVFWLRRRAQHAHRLPAESDRWRYAAMGGIVIATAMVALIGAALKAYYSPGQNTLHRFAFWTAVYSIATFTILFAIVAIAAYTGRNKQMAPIVTSDGKS